MGMSNIHMYLTNRIQKHILVAGEIIIVNGATTIAITTLTIHNFLSDT